MRRYPALPYTGADRPHATTDTLGTNFDRSGEDGEFSGKLMLK